MTDATTKPHKGGPRKPRPRPTAYARVGPVDSRGKCVILSTGRGDVSLTAKEALELAAELSAAHALARTNPQPEGAR